MERRRKKRDNRGRKKRMEGKAIMKGISRNKKICRKE
jgi:hypothetical protein